MQNRQNPFAETGAGSEFLGLQDDLGADFVGSDDQRELTPFQRQVYSATKRKEAEEKEKKREEMREQAGGSGGPSRPRNPRSSGQAGSSGMNQEETVRYINEDENPDYFDE
jgi:hypothetical protein